MTTLLLDALHCRNTGRSPVWLMRQAGRYMPEYRALRAKYSFLEMCHQPELIVETTLLPIRTFGMDAAILFSDILLIPEALRIGLTFEEGAGPIIERPLHTPADVEALPYIDIPEALSFVADGIGTLRQQLKVPLIGFCGAPFTVASYMIEGKSSRTLSKTKRWMLRDPASFHMLLNRLAACSIDYLNMQIDAGVQAIQIFDSWAGMLGFSQFCEFSLSYLEKITKSIKHRVPVILFCKGSSAFAPQLTKIAPHAISFDWNCDLPTMRQSLSSKIALQGNMDPDILHAPLDVVKKEVMRLKEAMRHDTGYIFNLGHGVAPDTPVEAVRTLIECIQS